MSSVEISDATTTVWATTGSSPQPNDWNYEAAAGAGADGENNDENCASYQLKSTTIPLNHLADNPCHVPGYPVCQFPSEIRFLAAPPN